MSQEKTRNQGKNNSISNAENQSANQGVATATLCPPPLQFKSSEEEQISETDKNIFAGKALAPPSLPDSPPEGNHTINKKADSIPIQKKTASPPFQLKVSGNSSKNSLPEDVRGKMENAFQADFSNVNIHQNSQSATDVGALAYAQGNDLHFAPGQFKPNTQNGQELIGHELAHVIQQRQGRVKATTQAKGGLAVNDDKGLEAEADEMGKKAAAGQTTSPPTQLKQDPNNNNTVLQKNDDDNEAESEGAVLQFPFELGEARTKEEASWKLLGLRGHFTVLKREIEETNEYAGDLQALQDSINGIDSLLRNFTENPQERLKAGEVVIASSFMGGWEDIYNTNYRSVQSVIQSRLRRVINTERIDNDTREIREAKRQAFENGNDDELEKLGNLVDAISDYNDKVANLVDRAGSIYDGVRESPTLQRVKEITGHIGTLASHAKNAVSAMKVIDGLMDGNSNSELHQDINRTQAALDGIDFGLSFVKAVPVLGALWTNYYYPVATKCLQMLGRIASIRNRDRRLLQFISSNWNSPAPPRISRGLQVAFPGGQSVFSFMWRIFFDNGRFNADAEEYFMDHESECNAALPEKMVITGAGLFDFWEDNHIQNFVQWAENNKEGIWQMLYGADLPYPGTNDRGS